MKKFYAIAFVLFALFIGCNRDSITNSNNEYSFNSSGAYILSEGGFSPGTAKLSFYSTAKDTFYTNIFNPGIIGLFSDGLVYSGGFLYMCEQGKYGQPGKFYKLDTNGAVLSSINAGVNPYSLAVSNNKAYLTNGSAGNVSVVDLNTFTAVKTIQVGVYPQEILAYSGKVFVCNTSLYGGQQDSTISIIDASADELIKTISVRKDPSSVCIANNKLVIGCPGDSSSARLYWLDLTTLKLTDSSTVLTNGFSKDISYNSNDNYLYYISINNNIVKYNISSKTESILIANTNPAGIFYYGYAYDATNKIHYLADAKNFSNNGRIVLYGFNGNYKKEYSTGVAPRRIVIKM